MQLKGYLITCKSTSSRIPEAINILNSLKEMEIKTVTRFDTDELINTGYEQSYWKPHMEKIKQISRLNIIRSMPSANEEEISKAVKATIQERYLKESEQSLSRKIMWAVSDFAMSNHKYILICEDDLRAHPKNTNIRAKNYLKNLVNEFIEEEGDFLDIGSLPPLDLKQNEIRAKTNVYMTQIKQPLTRSTCCFIMSKELAILAAKLLFPYALPIDMHLQYIFNIINENTSLKSYWSLPNYLCNASMIGSLSSSIQ